MDDRELDGRLRFIEEAIKEMNSSIEELLELLTQSENNGITAKEKTE